MPKNIYTTLPMLIALLCGAPAQAEIHKWTDANGVTHYSDSAPATGKSKVLDFVQIRRPGPPKKQQRETRKPKLVKQLNEQMDPSLERQLSEQMKAISKKPRRQSPTKHLKPQKPSAQISFKEFQLAPEEQLIEAVDTKKKPDLDAEEYDLQILPKSTKRSTFKNIKQKLCNDNRLLLAALQEKGFNAYYDEEGHYRLAWGGDGLYQGKRHFLEDTDVATKAKRVKSAVEHYCDNPNDQQLMKKARADWIRAEYCTLSKAVLEDLEHPFMRSTDGDIDRQVKKVERLCAEQESDQYRSDDRYFPKALQARVVLPRHLMLKEENTPEVLAKDEAMFKNNNPQETLEQLLALIE